MTHAKLIREIQVTRNGCRCVWLGLPVRHYRAGHCYLLELL